MVHAGSVVRCLAATAAIVLGLAGTVVASPVAMTLAAQDYAALGVTTPATGLMTSDYNYSNRFTGQVFSQAFNLSSGSYLYLYQADNWGPSVLDVLSVYPVYGAQSVGYLTANEPAGFIAGGIISSGCSWDQAPGANSLQYDYFPSDTGSVPAGNHSRVMYLISTYAPVVGQGYVIDSGVAVVEAYVAPEPATLCLLALGLLAGMARRRRS